MRAARWPLLGVVAAILVLVGGSWYQAVVTPAYFSSDEPGHVGYVLAMPGRRPLPEIDDESPSRAVGPSWWPGWPTPRSRARQMYVAKSPPWPCTYWRPGLPRSAGLSACPAAPSSACG